MPARLMTELELDVALTSRPVTSYTPCVRDGRHRGLLVENPEGKRTRTSFLELTDSSREYDAWCSFYSEVAAMARAVEPTLLQPLPWEKDLAAHVDEATWRDFVTTPLGEVIEKRFADDTVRGIVATDALVGTLRHAARPVAGAEPLLPLPADRPRHRRAAGPAGRDGRAQRRAGPGGRIGRGRDPRRRRRLGDPGR